MGSRKYRLHSWLALLALLCGICTLLVFNKVPPPNVEISRAFDEPLPDGAIARLGTTTFRHTSRVVTASVSSNNRLIATGDDGSMIHLWDAQTGAKVREIQTDTSGRKVLAFSPDGTVLAMVGNSVYFWDVESGRLIEKVRDREFESYLALAFSKNGRYLVVGTGGHHVGNVEQPSAVLILENPTGRVVRRLEGGLTMVEGVAFSPDGLTIASGSRDGSVRLWDTRTWKENARYGDKSIAETLVAFSPDGTILASGDWKGHVTARETRTGQMLWRSEPHGQPVGSLVFSPDGASLLSGAEYQTVAVLDAKTGRQREMDWSLDRVAWLCTFTPDGKRLIGWGDDRSLHFWNLVRAREEILAVGHTSSVRSIALSRDGGTIASVDYDTLLVWDNRNLNVARTFGRRDCGWSVACSPDGQWIASGGSDGKVRVWDKSGRLLRKFESPDSFVSDVAFSPDGRVLYSAHTYVVVAWDSETGKKLSEFGERPEEAYYERPIPPMSDLVVSPDGKRVACHSHRGLRIWDVSTGKETKLGDSLGNPLAFSPDGILACGWYEPWDSGIAFWKDGKEQLQIKLGDKKRCSALAFSPDGRSLAGANEDGIHIWAMDPRRESTVFKGYRGAVNCLAYSPDGNSLISCHSDTTVLVWDVRQIAKNANRLSARTP